MAWNNELQVKVETSGGTSYTVATASMAAPLIAIGLDPTAYPDNGDESDITATLRIQNANVTKKIKKLYGSIRLLKSFTRSNPTYTPTSGHKLLYDSDGTGIFKESVFMAKYNEKYGTNPLHDNRTLTKVAAYFKTNTKYQLDIVWNNGLNSGVVVTANDYQDFTDQCAEWGLQTNAGAPTEAADESTTFTITNATYERETRLVFEDDES